MKKLALFVFLFCLSPRPSHASTDVNVVLGSGTYSGVCVTTGTPVRVDDWVNGNVTLPTDSARIAVTVQNTDANYKIWCGWDNRVSTATLTASGLPNVIMNKGLNVGLAIKPNLDSWTFGALRQHAIWCQADDGAGTNCVLAHIDQWKKE